MTLSPPGPLGATDPARATGGEFPTAPIPIRPVFVPQPPVQPLPGVPIQGSPQPGQPLQGQPLPDWAPRPADPAGSWTFLDVLAGFGMLLLLSTVLGWPIRMWSGAPPTLALWVAGFAPVWIALLGTALWSSRHRGTGSLAHDLGLRFRPVDLAIGLGAGLGLRFATAIIALAVSQLTGHRLDANTQTITDSGGGGLLVLNLVIAGSLIAPVIEEIFFRGLLIRSTFASLYRRSSANDAATLQRHRWIAVATSAVLFALVHLQEVGDPYSAIAVMLGILLVGAVNAALAIKTGRLGPAIVTHIVFNLSAAALVFWL